MALLPVSLIYLGVFWFASLAGVLYGRVGNWHACMRSYLIRTRDSA